MGVVVKEEHPRESKKGFLANPVVFFMSWLAQKTGGCPTAGRDHDRSFKAIRYLLDSYIDSMTSMGLEELLNDLLDMFLGRGRTVPKMNHESEDSQNWTFSRSRVRL